jgi:hypothetical protein
MGEVSPLPGDCRYRLAVSGSLQPSTPFAALGQFAGTALAR